MATSPQGLSSTPDLRVQVAAAPRLRLVPLEHWHLLSLDAPAVAVTWTWYLIRLYGNIQPWQVLPAMFTAVWSLYALDRLLDAHRSHADLADFVAAGLEPRHRFHHRYRRLFRPGIVVAAVLLVWLLRSFPQSALLLYLALGALLAAWFALIHAFAPRPAMRLPKEFAVGIFFAAAVAIPVFAGQATARHLSALLASAGLLGCICVLNCLYIYAWEHPTPTGRKDAHASTRIALHHLRALSWILLVACLALAPVLPAAAALAAAVAFLLLLNRGRRWFTPTTLRAAADLALLTPLLFANGLR